MQHPCTRESGLVCDAADYGGKISVMRTLKTLRLDGFLSFAPGSEPIELEPLNVLIGPNGGGKSNLIEAVELLRATPTNVAECIRDGGGVSEWLWKGEDRVSASIEAVVDEGTLAGRPLRYRLEFTEATSRMEVLDEAVEEVEPQPGESDVYFYYRFQRGRPVANVATQDHGRFRRHLERESLLPDQSVLAQRKDPDQYPEVTWLGERFGNFSTFREWTIGRYAPLRTPQPADLPADRLLADSRNLALVLNQIEHHDGREFDSLLHRFLPQFERMTTRVLGGQVQFYLHERGLASPVPATRLSDGTIRFVAILAALLSPSPPPLLCIEEPELGLHPDALGIIGSLLVDASRRMQLIVTTHSDALVSALTAEAVMTCEKRGPGTVLTRLDVAELGEWLEQYQLGDLWRMGELGANP